MGGANCPETPRQKMIGMMYLVLTALLALNVSKDILDAFVIVNETMESTKETLYGKNAFIFNQFSAENAKNPGKVGKWFSKAEEAKAKSEAVIKEINTLKRRIVAYTQYGDRDLIEAEYVDHDGNTHKKDINDIPLEYCSAKDNYDKPMEILIGFTEDGRNGEAQALKEKLDIFKEEMKALLPERQHASIKFGIDTEDKYNSHIGMDMSWAVNTFYHTVLAADVVLLNQLITEVMNIEAEVTSKLMEEISASDFKFDKIDAKTIAKSNYVLQGSKYEADIFLAAYSTTEKPRVWIKEGIDSMPLSLATKESATLLDSVNHGMIRYSVSAAAIGPKKYAGIIQAKDPITGDYTKNQWFNGEYIVAKPTAIVAAKKMNVFYIGVDNPVEISVPGVPAEKIKPGISGGCKMSQKGGEYIVTCSSGTKSAKISVMAELDAGKSQSMGGSDFRVKDVPNPIAYIGGVDGGNISQAKLLAAGAIIPQMENFDFELYFTVTSFTFSIVVGSDIMELKGTGNKLSGEMTDLIKKARKGQKVYIEDIKAFGAGSSRKLASINLKII